MLMVKLLDMELQHMVKIYGLANGLEPGKTIRFMVLVSDQSTNIRFIQSRCSSHINNVGLLASHRVL